MSRAVSEGPLNAMYLGAFFVPSVLFLVTHQAVFGVLVIGAPLLAVGVHLALVNAARQRLTRYGIGTSAEVTRIYHDGGDSTSLHAAYRYEALGEKREGDYRLEPIGRRLRRPNVGDRITVLYDPAHPNVSGPLRQSSTPVTGWDPAGARTCPSCGRLVGRNRTTHCNNCGTQLVTVAPAE